MDTMMTSIAGNMADIIIALANPRIEEAALPLGLDRFTANIML